MLEQHEKAIRPTLAGIVLICFLLPFLKITCGGAPIASVSGIDLVIGKKLEQPSMFGEQGGFSNPSSQQNGNDMPFVVTNPETGETLSTNNDNFASTQEPDAFGSESGKGNIEANPIAMVALACAVVALFASFGPSRKGMLTSAICAGLTAALLFVLKSTLMSEMPSEMMGVLEIKWVEGFWVALCGSAVLAVITGKVMSGTPSDSRPKARVVIQTYSTDTTPSTPLKH